MRFYDSVSVNVEFDLVLELVGRFSRVGRFSSIVAVALWLRVELVKIAFRLRFILSLAAGVCIHHTCQSWHESRLFLDYRTRSS